jgi:ATP-dependent Clp protease ATP-binding subunit ClpA
VFATKQNVGMGRVVLDATEEARRRGDRRIGSDHLLLALLKDEDSVTARALGVDLATARAALVELDREALASVGIDIPVLDDALTGWRKQRLPLSPSAKAVFTGLRTRAEGERLGTRHVLLSVLTLEHPDPAADLLDALHVDRAAVRLRLSDT